MGFGSGKVEKFADGHGANINGNLGNGRNGMRELTWLPNIIERRKTSCKGGSFQFEGQKTMLLDRYHQRVEFRTRSATGATNM
jgi:hypothetical protein